MTWECVCIHVGVCVCMCEVCGYMNTCVCVCVHVGVSMCVCLQHKKHSTPNNGAPDTNDQCCHFSSA